MTAYHPSPIAIAVLLAWSVPAPSRAADEPGRSGTAVLPGPVFSALLTDATTATGRVVRLGPADVVLRVEEDDEDAERVIPFDTLVKLTRDGIPPPPIPPEGTLVLFPEGDRLRGIIGTADETTLEVTSDVLTDREIPLEAPLGVVLTAPAEAEALDALLTKLREDPRTSEVLWLANGDRLTGGLLALGAETIALQGDDGKVEVARTGAIALAFDPALVDYPRPRGIFLELTLADGTRLGVAGAHLEKGEVLATTRFGAPLRVPLADLVRVHVRGGAVTYLSERAEAAVQYVPYVGPTRPYRRDATVEGRPFVLSGQPYDRGLGAQSRTLLAYKLEPGDRRFQAMVGVDDRAGPLGSVSFRVLVDGRERFASPPLAARDPPRTIDIDVAGAKLLILLTEFGRRGGVRDLGDWVEARVVR
jgi:NPCBM/NEW2 domain